MKVLLFMMLCAAACHAQPYFDDSRQDRLIIGNNGYEVAVSKSGGGILSILDKSVGASLTMGSRLACLWGVTFAFPGPNAIFQCGNRFTSQGLSRFSYAWDHTSSILTLTFADNPASARRVNAVVTVNASATAYFDLQVTIDNRWDSPAGQVFLPFDLVFDAKTVEAGYLPLRLPGVRVKPPYFTSKQNACCVYPGIDAFADYQALDIISGHIAILTVNPGGLIQPASLGFADNTATAPQTFTASHAFQTSVAVGSSYTSPVVRVAIGLAARDTMLMYRTVNGIAAYPNIADKLGAGFDAMAQSPLVKIGWASMVRAPFAGAAAQLNTLSPPALLHPLEYEPGGFAAIVPDQLPPDPQWGSSDDFSSWVGSAQALGFAVMPYSNLTIWRQESPSAQNLPPPMTLPDVAVKDFQNQPVLGHYTPPGGPFNAYSVSPYYPYARDRTDQLMALWRDAVPVDFVFWDQVGSRPWLRDYNPASPDPIRYSDGWLGLWQTYAAQGLMTEDGWDRLAAAGIGFCGSPLTGTQRFNWSAQKYGMGSNGNRVLGDGNWDPYPLATWLLHDKVLLYQHDLEEVATTQTTEVITWNLAFGNMLSYVYPLVGPPGDTGPGRAGQPAAAASGGALRWPYAG